MFDENEEENEKKNQRTNGRRRLTTLSSARGDISCILIVFSNVCAHAVENDRGRLKIEPVFILMLSVYYYYIIIFNAFTTSTISKISNYSLSVRANSKTFARSFLVSSLRSI